MRRITAFLMMIAITISLTACGSGSPYNAPAMVPAEGENSSSVGAPAVSTPEPVEESEPDIIEPQLEPTAEPNAVEGLIAMSVTTGKEYKYNNAFCRETTIILTSIDMETGATHDVRTFTNTNTRDFTIDFDFAFDPVNSLQRFDEGFDRMVACRRMPDGSDHVGFVDSNGVFTDVSALVTVPAGDFGGLIKHTYPRFGPDGYFYYRDQSNGGSPLYRINTNNAMTPDALELHSEKVSVDYYFIQPDGSVIDGFNVLYYSPSMTHRAPEYISAWVDDTTFVGGGYKSDLIYKYTALTDEEWKNKGGAPVHAYADRTALVPDINNRANSHALVSPDKKTVAFLSRLTSGSDRTPYLFTVPLDGGEPVKTDVSYVFNYPVNVSDGSYSYRGLLAWMPSGT
ncbi:MAG: hypothetical protein ACK5MN_10620 [Lachnospiraceae bacterium]